MSDPNSGTQGQTPEDIRRVAPPRTFSAGETVPGLSSWALVRKLGGGGFGEVWLARHAWDKEQKRRAVKFCTDPEARHRLVTHERNVVVRVMKHAGKHPNIVPLLDCNLDGDVPWLMYEFVDGGTLAGLIGQWQQVPLPDRLGAVVRILRALASALATCHRLNPPLVHRDMKPQNVLMAASVPRITDFGIGSVVPQQHGNRTGTLTTNDARLPSALRNAGTRLYAPPEQMLGSPPNPRDDVYALGIIAYQMVIGDLFSSPGADTNLELCRLKPPGELVSLIVRSVAMNPERRVSDATAWEKTLAAIIAKEQLQTGTGAVLSRSKPVLLDEVGRPLGAEAETAPVEDVRPVTPTTPGKAKRQAPRPAQPAPVHGPKPPPLPARANDPSTTAEEEDDVPAPRSRTKQWVVLACLATLALSAVLAAVLGKRGSRVQQQPPIAETPERKQNVKSDRPTPFPAEAVPKAAEPKPKEKEPAPGVPPIPIAVAPVPGKPAEPVPPPVEPDPFLKINPPSERRAIIGRVDTQNVLVVSRRTDPAGLRAGLWGRLPYKGAVDIPDTGSVFSADPVMALPGYKANVVLGEPFTPMVEVHLWGNVPEQVQHRVLESKVTFHQPPLGFDADLTLQAGRIYLKNTRAVTEKKPVPVKVRVRLAHTREVWDVTLPDENADVMVELISWFKPGTPFVLKDGPEPRREVSFAVVQGSAAFQVSGNRFKKFDRVEAGLLIRWDSVTGAISDTVPANKQDIARVPVVDENQKLVTQTLSDTAKAVVQPDVVLTILRVRLDPPQDVVAKAGVPRDLLVRLSIYAWGALADSTDDGCKMLQDLVDILNSDLPWLGRQAVVTTLAQWLARDRENTARLHALFVDPDFGIKPASTAGAVLEMLRGYIDPMNPDPARLDKLLERLAGAKAGEFEKPEKATALRDVALWNLASADTGLWIPPPVAANVGVAGAKFDSPEYQKFLNEWRTRVDTIKRRAKMPK
jgi:serine/threonine protein kinase